MVINLSKWFGIAFLIIGVGIYRYYMGEVSALEMGVVGAISGGVGGAIGGMYDHFFGKYDESIIKHLDTLAGFILRLALGLFAAFVCSIEMEKGILQTIVFLVVTFGITLPLTYRMLKKKRTQQNNQTLDN